MPGKRKGGRMPQGERKSRHYTTSYDEEELFQDWCKTQSQKETAKRKNISRSIVNKLCQANNWVARYQKNVLPRIQKESDRRAARSVIRNLETVRTVKLEVLSKLQAMNIKPSYGDFVKIVELEEKLLGTIGDTTHIHDERVLIIVNEADKANASERSRIVGNALAVLGDHRQGNRN